MKTTKSIIILIFLLIALSSSAPIAQDYIYWANYGSNSISRASIDGSGEQQFWITGCYLPIGIAVNSTN